MTLIVAVALALVVLAAPVSADSHAIGETTYGAVAARTGDFAGYEDFWGPGISFMDPAGNRCLITDAGFTMTSKRAAEMWYVESCFGTERPPSMWDVHIAASGRLWMEPIGSFYPDMIATNTGCALNGSFPKYHGHFDGSHFFAAGEFHGICDGGAFWEPWGGISAETGPLHARFTIEFTLP